MLASTPTMRADDVPLLWTQPPRFIEMMRGAHAGSNANNTFQHPHYFFAQTDKLSTLLQRLRDETAAVSISSSDPDAGSFQQAHDALLQLLDKSQCFSCLTREQLRQLEPAVRAFVDQLQHVDAFVADWEAKMEVRRRAAQMARKRGREEELAEVDAVAQEVTTGRRFATFKRRRGSCSAQFMDVEAAFAATAASSSSCMMVDSPWSNYQAPAVQHAMMWTESA